MNLTPSNDNDTTFWGDETSQPVASLRLENIELKHRVAELERQVEWFQRQIFGQKSERRIIDNPKQAILTGLDMSADLPSSTQEPKQQITYERGTGKKNRSNDDVNNSGLRFGPDVPVEQVDVLPPELKGSDADSYVIIDTKIHFKLAQRSASYVVLQYNLPVVKKRNSNTIKSTKMPLQVIEGSLADVSFIAGLLVDKFQYHLPLHRQHQRLMDAGITVARSTLTNLAKSAGELLRPIYNAQLCNVLKSHVLSMDETPIKAGRQPSGGGRPGKMKQGWFWPLYGDQDEIVFTYSSSRSSQHVRDVLANEFKGVLLSDGYSAYASYTASTDTVQHAQCWVHTRRGFIKAESAHPDLSAQVLDTIGMLYRIEANIKSKHLISRAKFEYRQTYSAPIVEQLMAWAKRQLQENSELLPSDALTKALKYMVKREKELSVFLHNPAVALDTNHLERGLRPIPLGRKNWNFCWTEIGAEQVGIIQSLVATCKIHDINVTDYLIDVLQRVSIHPSHRVEELTPRRWKDLFSDCRLTSFVHCQGDRHAH